MSEWYEYGTYFDWITPLLGLLRVAGGDVELEGTAHAIDVLEKAGVSCHAPMLIHETGGYLFTVSKRDLPKVRRVAARAGVEVW